MTVMSATNKAGPYTRDGIATVYPFSFVLFAAADLLVTKADTGGTETTPAYLTDYTVALNADQDASPGGSITMLSVGIAGEKLTLTSNVALTQETDIQNAGGFYPDLYEAALDKLTKITQQLTEKVGRTLQSPVTSALTAAQWFAQQVASAGGVLLPLSITQGGTGATSAGGARTALGSTATGDAVFVAANAAAARTALGLGSAATLTAGTGANNAVQLDGASKLPAVDGSQLTGLNTAPPVRQTVLNASVDASGLPNFMSGVGTTTLTVAGSAGTPFVATSANGAGASGNIDRTGSSTANLTLAGQSTNGTYYAYVDIAANGTLTLGASSLAPTYQTGGAYSTTNGQFTFNWLGEMVGKLGNGSVAAQAYRTYIGEFTVAANVIATVTPYAIQGRYAGETNYASNTKMTLNHNLGVQPSHKQSGFALRCATAALNYAVNDEVPFECLNSTGQLVYTMVGMDRLAASAAFAGATSYLKDKNSAFANTALTDANWKLKLYAKAPWV